MMRAMPQRLTSPPCPAYPAGQTALHHAVVVGRAELVTWLLDSGLDPSRVNTAGDTAVKVAVQQHLHLRDNSLPGLRALLQWRAARLASPSTDHSLRRRLEGLLDTPGSRDGVPPAAVAVRNRFIEALHLLLANGASPLTRSRMDSSLPIHMAAQNGWLPEAKLLAAVDPSPAHLNAASDMGDRMTPPMMAAAGGHLDVVEWLLRQPGVSPESTTALQQNLYHISATYGYVPLLTLLLGSASQPPAAPRPLAMAGDSDGDTAIHVAACFGNLSCVQCLVEALGGEAVFAKNKRGHTAYEVAVLQDQQQVAAWLKENVPGSRHTRPEATVTWDGPGSALSGRSAHMDEVHAVRLREQQQRGRR